MATEGRELKEQLESLVDKTQDLAETAYKLALIEGAQQITKVASSTLVISIFLLLLNFLLLFLGLGAASWIGNMLGDVKYGYFIVGGVYLLLILFILLFRKKLIIPFLRNLLVQKLYDTED